MYNFYIFIEYNVMFHKTNTKSEEQKKKINNF
jgi:hypothetical protein